MATTIPPELAALLGVGLAIFWFAAAFMVCLWALLLDWDTTTGQVSSPPEQVSQEEN